MGSGGRDRERCAPKLYKSPSSLFPVGTRPRSLLSTVTSIAIIPVSLCGPVSFSLLLLLLRFFLLLLVFRFCVPAAEKSDSTVLYTVENLYSRRRGKEAGIVFPPATTEGFLFTMFFALSICSMITNLCPDKFFSLKHFNFQDQDEI